MTNEPKFVQIKAVYPKGYKHQSMGYSKAPKTDWWKPEKLNKPQPMWGQEDQVTFLIHLERTSFFF